MTNPERARAVAWNVYAARVETIVNEQHDSFMAGNSVCPIQIAPPTKRHAEIILTALDLATRDATRAVIDRALAPLVRALDAIDNSHSKSETVKECRAAIQVAYDELHKLRQDMSLGQPVTADAVDPVDGESNG